MKENKQKDFEFWFVGAKGISLRGPEQFYAQMDVEKARAARDELEKAIELLEAETKAVTPEDDEPQTKIFVDEPMECDYCGSTEGVVEIEYSYYQSFDGSAKTTSAKLCTEHRKELTRRSFP